uniref:Uncharacterized protein n=1 Tax=Manihot esculenta TaxID=3983 RepID=A0A2C9WE19_MANES
MHKCAFYQFILIMIVENAKTVYFMYKMEHFTKAVKCCALGYKESDAVS